MKSIQTRFQKQIDDLKSAIDSADSIIIGAGAGLSTSAGFEYLGKRFEDNFADFASKYKFRDMYSGGFYPYATLEEFWAYWSRYIYINRYLTPPKDVYNNLFEIVKDKDYFVLTTNVDHCFQKAGFNKNRLFYMQGDYGLFQCSLPCHDKTYDNKDIIMRMVKEQSNMKIPKELIPRCPKCFQPMTVNLRSDNRFVEDKGWHKANSRWEEYVENHKRGKILFLELGVGQNTSSIIKYPFWAYTMQNRNAVYACINLGEAVCPERIRERSICIDGDIATVLESILCQK